MFFCIVGIEKFEISKRIFSISYFIISLCSFMTNFKVVGEKTAELWSFYVLSVFCIFGIEKFEISKRIFSKVYFRIMLCMFVANYMVVALKTTEL